MDRIGEVDSEGLVELVNIVAVDHDGNRLRCGRVGGEAHRPTLCHVVGPGVGRSVGGGVLHRDALRARGRDGHGEVGVDRRADIRFGQGHIVYGNRRSIVVGDDRRNLLRAGLGAVGHTGDVNDDALVQFIHGILHRGQGNRTGGAARGDHDRSRRASVITR